MKRIGAVRVKNLDGLPFAREKIRATLIMNLMAGP